MTSLRISCHCGAVKGTVLTKGDLRLDMCHCHACRHATGQLYSSYYAIEPPSPGLRDALGIATHDAIGSGGKSATRRYFCRTCGTHLLRRIVSNSGQSQQQQQQQSWGVTSGIADGPDERSAPGLEGGMPELGCHRNVETTGDGGLSIWLPKMTTESSNANDGSISHGPDEATATATTNSSSCQPSLDGALSASCLCRRVTFRITRPNHLSRLPQSGFPDLIVPFHSSSADADVANQADEKWWLRDDGTKYLAGLCACRSCRLASGFELQSWTFVPRANIVFFLPAESPPSQSSTADTEGGGSGNECKALDFDDVHARGLLVQHKSSPGVMREFCAGCGATVFWHDTARPELVDVSVGLLLLQSPAGARAEGLLDWWRGRVSFAEDAGLGRSGKPGVNAVHLVRSVERDTAS